MPSAATRREEERIQHKRRRKETVGQAGMDAWLRAISAAEALHPFVASTLCQRLFRHRGQGAPSDGSREPSPRIRSIGGSRPSERCCARACQFS